MAATDNTKDQLKIIRAAIDLALAPIAAEYGLSSLRCGSGSYGAGNFTLKVEGVMGDGKKPEEDIYDQLQAALELPARGFQFVSGGIKYKVVGMKPRTYKVICEAENGGRYLFSNDTVAFKAKMAGPA